MAATSVSALVFLLFCSLLWIHRTNFKASNNKCSVYGQLFAEGDSSTSFCTHVFGSRLPTRRLNLAPHGFHRSRTPRSLWSPRGYNSLLVPGHDPPQGINIYIFMDIALNPGTGASGSLTGASSINASFLVDHHGDFDPVIAFSLPTKGFKIMHLNLCSLRNKLDFIRILLLKLCIDILTLTETWLDETWNDVEITAPGYSLFRKDRKSNIQSRSCAGGGVIIYARDGTEGKRRGDLESDELEQICLEPKQNRCASFFLSCLYRPENTSAAFLTHFC